VIHINSYALESAAGPTVERLWSELTSKADETRREFSFHGPRPATVRQLLGDKLMSCFAQTKLPSGRLGVILASTKGFSDDFIWDKNASLETDPLTPLLDDFIQRAELKPERKLCVSNACSSALAAMRLAQIWLNNGLDQVLVLAADAATPFVQKGFQSLNLVTKDYPRPFATNRSGFFLGEAAACLVLSKERVKDSVRLLPVGLDTEGSAVTRPATSSASLLRACARIPGIPRARAVDLIIAHGTATMINDETEDLAYSALFGDSVFKPFLTGSKWRVGHTLGASGAVDTILACEALKRNRSFALEASREIDPALKCRYLGPGMESGNLHRILVSSLGFGGMHAAAVLEPPAEAMA
jgi:hypothetical protein